jgi:ribosomal protein L14E/L6E/L27E
MEIEKGSAVLSTAGRDKGKVFLVLELLEKGFFLLADGKSRTVAKPKRKKQKHLSLLEMICVNETIENRRQNRRGETVSDASAPGPRFITGKRSPAIRGDNAMQ